jgi:hypothetical protein
MKIAIEKCSVNLYAKVRFLCTRNMTLGSILVGDLYLSNSYCYINTFLESS